ncbi:hypothetical protein LXM96_18375 [Rhizobium sp. TRM95001]|nr:hypothetical protein [Rhizobium halophilum]MCF6370805.1 hypothetical protein [Rhizobium halophilum]
MGTIDFLEEGIRDEAPSPVPEDLASTLQVAPGGHALELRRNYLDKDATSQIISLSILPAEHYCYEITLRRQA